MNFISRLWSCIVGRSDKELSDYVAGYCKGYFEKQSVADGFTARRGVFSPPQDEKKFIKSVVNYAQTYFKQKEKKNVSSKLHT